MVKLIEDISSLDFLPADPYAARITALAVTYGTGYDFALFWVQSIDEKSVAAVCRVDGNMTVCCDDGADYEELSAFINAVGFLSLQVQMAQNVIFNELIDWLSVRVRGANPIDTTKILPQIDASARELTRTMHSLEQKISQI